MQAYNFLMNGLVLSGGGARGAYQVGVLTAIAEIAAELKIKNPFSIFSGVSAGAINASSLASNADDFQNAARQLVQLWSNLNSDQVFRTDAISLGRIGLQWMGELSFGALGGTSPTRSLLDTAPLADLIRNNLHFDKIDTQILDKKLYALAITGLDYKTSTAITFVHGQPNLPMWERTRRRSECASIRTEHIMASSAIPLLFPPIQIDDRFFGDGCVRNQTPCSPALHLGSQKLVVIGVRKQSDTSYEQRVKQSRSTPSVAKVINEILNSVLLDGVELDIERLNRINEFVNRVPEAHQKALNFKKVDYVWISPSQDIGAIAASLSTKLPRIIRYLLKGLGPLEDASEIISYLLFEPSFCQKLIEIGYEDGLRQKDELIKLFEI